MPLGCALLQLSLLTSGQHLYAQSKVYKLACSDRLHKNEIALRGARFGAQDAGFDLQASPEFSANACSSEHAFFVSVREPEGNYRVTVELGGPQESATTVKAESRRLMLEHVVVPAAEKEKHSFVVNLRTPALSGSDNVHLKPREIGSLDWDDKLTLEFTGKHPSVRSIRIEPVNVSTIYLAGDSTVVDQDKEPWAAWGQMLPVFFDDKIAVANHAESGETIRSFETERRWDKIMSTLRAGDWLFMQFAHNDQKPGRGFVSISEYKDLLRKYIQLAQSKGAHPTLVTSMNRRTFDADGKIKLTLGEYPDAMREVAREQHVPLIDLNTMSKTLYEAMGPEGSVRAFVHYPANTFQDQPEPLKDDTHFNSYGALELAKCVVQAIRDLKLPLAKELRHGVAKFDPAHPDPPSIWIDQPDPFLSAVKPYER